jgi:hypothetical protein
MEIFRCPSVVLLWFSLCFAFHIYVAEAGEIIYASYKYTMGDNDTKNDARRICFLEAKRLAIEKAGTYLESTTEVRNFQLARDEIRTFAGAILKVEIASEEVKFVGESVTIFMTVKADVDVEAFRERVKQIKADRDLEAKVKEQQLQIGAMEGKIKDLQKTLSTKNLDEVVKARMDRKEAFDKIDELERIKLDIRAKTKVAIGNVELGMTKEEVIRVAGRPRSIGRDEVKNCEYNYGNVWVILESGVVSCIVSAEVYSNYTPCSWYRSFRRSHVIK